MSKRKLEGRAALITGAGRGIGRAIAVAYAREGAKVAATARTAAEVQSLIDQIRSEGGEARGFPADLLDPKVPADLIRKTVDAFGGIDILVNNAGMGSSAGPRPVVNFDDDFWNRTLALNLTAPYLLSKAVLPIMLGQKRGRIVNIASINGKIGALHGAAYAASKHGLLGLTRSLALEVARDGITVNAICPGPVHTVMNDLRLAYDVERLGTTLERLESSLTPIGRRLEPEECAPMAVLLASDEAAAITGQAFNVCGGMLMAS
jgi:ketoreductase